MFLDQIKVADLHVTAGLLQSCRTCPDLSVLPCGLFAGRASLIPRHLPTRHWISWPINAILGCGAQKFELVLSEYRTNSEDFRSNFKEI